MIGILLEIFGGDIPEFLHPVKSVILPVSENFSDYAQNFKQVLMKKNNYQSHECILDDQNLPLQKRIANASSQCIPNIFVVGKKEFQYYQDYDEFKAMLRNHGENKEYYI